MEFDQSKNHLTMVLTSKKGLVKNANLSLGKKYTT
jgi:hypothetical protein